MTKKKRNKKSPCTCGSGKRYEKCCRSRDLAINEARRIFAARKARTDSFKQKHGAIFEPELVECYGKKLVAVGGSILDLGPNNQSGNFYTFIHEYALSFFGTETLDQQYRHDERSRHPALTWVLHFLEFYEKEPVTGSEQAWMRFAYDLYITHGYSTLQEELKNRLLIPSKFQTARTELWAAALFIVAGFDIEYLSPDDSKTPEFIATCKTTGFKLHVEAKCKQRSDLMNYKGGIDEIPGENIRLKSLIKRAVKKVQDIPLVAVVEASLPPVNGGRNIDNWNDQLNDVFLEIGGLTPEKKCKANLVLVYNDPSYYYKEAPEINDTEPWSIDYRPIYVKNRADSFEEIYCRIKKAVAQKHNIPTEFLNRS